MPTPEQVEAALEDLEPGTEVRIELGDGRHVDGTYAGAADGKIKLDDVDPNSLALGEEDGIALEDVEGVVEMISSEGPE